MMTRRFPRIIVAAALALSAGGAVSFAHDPIESSLETVARFLELSPDQVEATARLLRHRHLAIAPIRQEIAEIEARLEELIRRGDDPGAIGALVLALHERRGAIREIEAEFVAAFDGLLNDEQRRRFSSARAAKKLQPVLPAFERLGLL